MLIRLSEDFLDLHLVGIERVLTGRSHVRLPPARILRAFVVGRSFARNAGPRWPFPGWSTRWSRTGVFGFGERAQLWSVGSRPVVLALYLRDEPYHRIVCEVEDPIYQAATINRWLHQTSAADRCTKRTPR